DILMFFFFFSSRRRHTRFSRDWSSDVLFRSEHLAWHCRTQLPDDLDALQRVRQQIRQGELDERAIRSHYEDIRQAIQSVAVEIRSEERRVGKECGSGGSPYQ